MIINDQLSYLLFDNFQYLIKYIFINYIIYNSIEIILNFKNVKFKNYSTSRKKYIVKNICKSFVLFYLTTKIHKLIYQLYLNKLENELVHNYATIYVSTDILALLIVPNLPDTTKTHHKLTTLLLFINYFIDYTQHTHIGLLLIIYTIFSTLSFLVNFFLAIRFLYDRDQTHSIKVVAYNNYLVCCIINWGTHIYYICVHSFMNYSNIPYFLLYSIIFIPIVKDDLILMSWLQD